MILLVSGGAGACRSLRHGCRNEGGVDGTRGIRGEKAAHLLSFVIPRRGLAANTLRVRRNRAGGASGGGRRAARAGGLRRNPSEAVAMATDIPIRDKSSRRSGCPVNLNFVLWFAEP